MYELLSNPVDRKICFAKFPQVENPVDFVLHVGGYLRKEINRRKPAPKPSARSERIRFRFNAALLSDAYELPPAARAVVAKQRAELLADVASLKERSLHSPEFFPEVFNGSDEHRRAARAKAEEAILKDRDSLLHFYGQLRSPKGQPRLPPKRLLSEEWALYRWLQIELLFAIDLYARYGPKLSQPLGERIEEKIEHDVLDSQYMLLGVLEGAFATRETKLRNWFTAICPNGRLYG